mmetsp:Transcript_17729/g.24656  ORF Transcript_17729/g.24656 Transcript_17729/m.24656 type:complete len:90 (+) Transcript_17729:182-451(+)
MYQLFTIAGFQHLYVRLETFLVTDQETIYYATNFSEEGLFKMEKGKEPQQIMQLGSYIWMLAWNGQNTFAIIEGLYRAFSVGVVMFHEQ